MAFTNPESSPLRILVIGRDPKILQVVLRLLNTHASKAYHAVGTTDADQARSLFADSDIGLVLLTNGIDAATEASLREEFAIRRPGVPVLQHYGGGSGLLFGEIAAATGRHRQTKDTH
ncbi:MAG TPA: hypothetical protein VN616_15145 [Puia sp.]|nr:hypothetical protein [Puia sp.]